MVGSSTLRTSELGAHLPTPQVSCRWETRGPETHAPPGRFVDISHMRFSSPAKRHADRGASMVEYGLLVSLLSVVAFTGISMVGHKTEDTFDIVAQGLDGQVVESIGVPEDEAAEGETAEEEVVDESGDPDSPSDGGDDSSGGDDSGGSVPPGGDDAGGDVSGEDPVEKEPVVETKTNGSETAISSSGSELISWKADKKGGKGDWAATFDFQNEWSQDQYLTVHVSVTDEKGKTRTTKTTVFVPAGKSATYSVTDNDITVKDDNVTGVVSVNVKVVSVTTNDGSGQPVSYDVDGPSSTVEMPDTP